MQISKKIGRRSLEIGDAKFFVVPYPYDEIKSDVSIINSPQLQKAMFMYCLVGWEGLQEDDGSPLEFNDENKEHIFKYEHGIRKEILFVVNTMMVEKVQIIKNLLRSQDGKGTPES